MLQAFMEISRSSHQTCFIKKSVFENSPKFTGKYLYQSSFLIKLQASGSLAQVFSSEFCKIFKNTFFTGHLRVTASGSQNPFTEIIRSHLQKMLRKIVTNIAMNLQQFSSIFQILVLV